MWDFVPLDAFRDTTWPDAAVPDDLTLTDCEFECHSCGERASGYQMGELMVDHGWRLHSTGRNRPLFVMCGDCETVYTKRWDAT